MSDSRDGAPTPPATTIDVEPDRTAPVVMAVPASPSAAAPAPTPMAVAAAICQFTVASIVMVAGNKSAVTHLPLPCTLVIIQALGTLALLWIFYRSQVQGLKRATVELWLPVSILFTLMLFSSMKAMVYSTVSTFLILRNVGPIFTTAAEFLLRKMQVTVPIVVAELLIVAGAVIYTGGAVDFSPLGLFWILVNVTGQVMYGVVLKSKMETPQLRDTSKFTMSFYNNLLCLPMVLAVLVLQGEHEALLPAKGPSALATVSLRGWGIIALTCIFGFVISTSGFAVQKLVSATTFLIINNLSKFANILFGVFVMGDRVEGLQGISGCVLALGAGAYYSYEQMKLAERLKRVGAQESKN